MSETFLTKEQGRKIAEIIGGSQGCGAIWNVIMGDLDNPYCDGFVIGGHPASRSVESGHGPITVIVKP